IAVSPDETLVATAASHDHTIVLWTLDRGERVQEFDFQPEPLVALSFSPDARLLAAASEASVFLWDLETGRQRARLDSKLEGLVGFGFSTDGRQLHAWDHEGQLVVFDVGTATELRRARLLDSAETPPEHAQLVSGLSADGRLAAMVSAKTIDVWQTEP